MKNLVNRQQLLFTGTEWHSKFGSKLCKIHWEKHPRAFVKVVECSEIYNFPIHHFVHFHSNFLSFKRSNRGAVAQFRASRTAPQRRAPRVRRASRDSAFSHARAHIEASRSLPCHVPRTPSSVGRTACARRSAPCLRSTGAPTDAARRTAVKGRILLRTRVLSLPCVPPGYKMADETLAHLSTAGPASSLFAAVCQWVAGVEARAFALPAAVWPARPSLSPCQS
jgi:hypothetical protein